MKHEYGSEELTFMEWLGVKWRDFKFNLGYKIGGFTSAKRD